MTADLAGEIVRILTDERLRPAMSADSLRRVLTALGFSPLPSETEIVQALDALIVGESVEAVSSARLGRRFRVVRGHAA
jgi:hypothetical protein